MADERYYGLGRQESILVLLVFGVEIEAQREAEMKRFYVVDVKDRCMLGEGTVRDLNLITRNVVRDEFLGGQKSGDNHACGWLSESSGTV